MKVTKFTTYMVPPRWLFLKIDTDEGISGWGEPVLEGRASAVAAEVEELSDYVIGKDPRQIEDIWTVLYRGGFYRGGGLHMSALAGIDQALWDIKGKALGVPVHQLLGGQCRDRIRVYSWIGGGTVASLGVRRPSRLAGAYRWRAGISVRSRSRASHCRRRSEPGAGDRPLVATSASAVTCSSGGSPENWPSLR